MTKWCPECFSNSITVEEKQYPFSDALFVHYTCRDCGEIWTSRIEPVNV